MTCSTISGEIATCFLVTCTSKKKMFLGHLHLCLPNLPPFVVFSFNWNWDVWKMEMIFQGMIYIYFLIFFITSSISHYATLLLEHKLSHLFCCTSGIVSNYKRLTYCLICLFYRKKSGWHGADLKIHISRSCYESSLCGPRHLLLHFKYFAENLLLLCFVFFFLIKMYCLYFRVYARLELLHHFKLWSF